MNTGRIAVGFTVLTAALGGALLWYTAEWAFYEPVVFVEGQEMRLVSLATGQPEPLAVGEINAIDATSSPIKFRACFTTPTRLAELVETFQPYPRAQPLIAPRWFDCFDAGDIGRALQSGEARAFLAQAGIHTGVDRVVAVFADGRGYAWQQLDSAFAE